jgi:hypothetical protein
LFLGIFMLRKAMTNAMCNRLGGNMGTPTGIAAFLEVEVVELTPIQTSHFATLFAELTEGKYDGVLAEWGQLYVVPTDPLTARNIEAYIIATIGPFRGHHFICIQIILCRFTDTHALL